MFPPGYYKINYRRLRFRELVRLQSFERACLNYFVTRLMRPGPGGWMPSLWADTECRREDLSAPFWRAIEPYRSAFAELGFAECSFFKSTKSLSRLIHDSGNVLYVDATRRHVGTLSYLCVHNPTSGQTKERVNVRFTAIFERGSLTCTNRTKAFDPPDENEVIRFVSRDPKYIYDQFIQILAKRNDIPRQFPDMDSLRRIFDERQIKSFEERARRRLYVPMTDQEVADAKAELRGADPKPSFWPKESQIRLGLIVLVLATIGLLEFFRTVRVHGSDTILYHGQEFRMRRNYATYEDYKEDPDNLDTSELGRIEETMESVKIPASYGNRQELFRDLMELKFPGYGLEGFNGAIQTDDGSSLVIESVEIPQRGKERFIVVRDFAGQMTVLDDFVFSSSTNAIQRVKLQARKLEYYNNNGSRVREKVF